MKEEFIEKIYAGWLAKIIGIRLGAPIEGWTYHNIQNALGEPYGYITNYKNFAADDDSNGPLFLVRALEDNPPDSPLTPQAVAEALLNYAPHEHGFFWWGGYGISTEHTAYLNLCNGIPAPASGNIAQNGHAVAEQIGGQIFSDCWGLANPGKPEKAANYAAAAASVTHDGNGVYGGMFIAACISCAFIQQDIEAIIHTGLSCIPPDSEYARTVRSVLNFHTKNPLHWRRCYEYIYENFGYDRYPGTCHIIPNAAVIILALLYGKGDFSNTLNICNLCGWDTDCNVGNVATIMGVRNGLSDIATEWRAPINDLLINSSVIGSLNITDIPYGAAYMVKQAYALSQASPPPVWQDILHNRIHSCHFEFSGSTHAIRVRGDEHPETNLQLEYYLQNTQEHAATGQHSLKITAKPLDSGQSLYIYQKTYYTPNDFNDSRYDPSFSPTIYPGQTLHGSIYLPDYTNTQCYAQLYVQDAHSGQIICGTKQELTLGAWHHLIFPIPPQTGALLDEMGIKLTVLGTAKEFGAQNLTITCLIDDLYATGTPEYELCFATEHTEIWNVFHREVSQMTRLKGLLYLEGGTLHLSCADFGEAYTGGYDWKNYRATFHITPIAGPQHMVNFRVQGGMRSYAAALLPNNKLALLKNNNGYCILAETDFIWQHGKEYLLSIQCTDNILQVCCNSTTLYSTDFDKPYLYGGIGISVREGSHICCKSIQITP